MRNRIKALLLGAALTVSVCSGAYAAQEASSEGVVEPISEAAAQAMEDADGQSQFAPYYDQMKASVSSTLDQLSAMTDEQLQEIVEGNDPTSALIAANWMNVKDELGIFTGVKEQTVEEEGNIVTVRTVAEYDSVPDNTVVNVNYIYDFKKTTSSIEWDVKYPMSKLISEAGLNTLLGLGTVFIVLVFLSIVIGNIHWIPDLIEKRKKGKEQVIAPAPVVTEKAAEPKETEELVDDTELVAVIAAAIAAYDEVPADGFVVRSIRKANRRKWLGA